MTTELSTTIYDFGEFRLDEGKRLLFRNGGENIPLTPKVFDTLLYLAQHSGKVISKDELMREIWSDTIVEENNLNKNISVLRRTLGEKPGEHRYIVTIPGQGYKFVAAVEKSEPDWAGPGTRNDSLQSEVELGLPPNVPAKAQKPLVQNRIWLWPLVALGVVIIALAAFYVWRQQSATAEAPIRTIAVLPFKPLRGENRSEELELGMADALISKLSGVESIVVRPLGAVRRFGSLEQDPLAAGRELGVESILDGTIQTAEDRLRVSARLVRTSDGLQLWADQFDEKFVDIFAVQDSISRRVAAALKIKLEVIPKKHPTENIEAYQLYMKGRFQILKLRPSETQKGEVYFRQAIELDPNYALAYLGLANANRSFTMAGEMTPTVFMPKAIAAAERAIELDDTLADAHAELCYLVLRYEWDWRKAEKSCSRALQLDPNNAEAYHAYAHVYSISGRSPEAVAAIRRARELDPLNLRISGAETQFLIGAGQVDSAIDLLQKNLELDANFWFTHVWVASAYIEKGMYDDAIRAANLARELSDGATQGNAFLGYALARSGRRAEARAEADGLIKLSATRYVPAYNIAMIYNGLDDRDETIAWLERGIADRDPRMIFLMIEPKWNNLRNDPQFVAIRERAGFE